MQYVVVTVRKDFPAHGQALRLTIWLDGPNPCVDDQGLVWVWGRIIQNESCQLYSYIIAFGPTQEQCFFIKEMRSICGEYWSLSSAKIRHEECLSLVWFSTDFTEYPVRCSPMLPDWRNKPLSPDKKQRGWTWQIDIGEIIWPGEQPMSQKKSCYFSVSLAKTWERLDLMWLTGLAQACISGIYCRHDDEGALNGCCTLFQRIG